MPDVWPGTGVRVYRQGNDITIDTKFDPHGTTIGGRSTYVAAQGMCLAVIGDLEYDPSLSVKAFAGDGTTLVSAPSGGECA